MEDRFSGFEAEYGFCEKYIDSLCLEFDKVKDERDDIEADIENLDNEIERIKSNKSFIKKEGELEKLKEKKEKKFKEIDKLNTELNKIENTLSGYLETLEHGDKNKSKEYVKEIAEIIANNHKEDLQQIENDLLTNFEAIKKSIKHSSSLLAEIDEQGGLDNKDLN